MTDLQALLRRLSPLRRREAIQRLPLQERHRLERSMLRPGGQPFHNNFTTISRQFNFCCNLPPSCWSASIAFASYCQFTTCPNLNSLSQTSIVCSIWFVCSFKTLQTALRLMNNYCVSHQPLFSLPCSCGGDPSAWRCFVNVTTQMHFLLVLLH